MGLCRVSSALGMVVPEFKAVYIAHLHVEKTIRATILYSSSSLKGRLQAQNTCRT